MSTALASPPKVGPRSVQMPALSRRAAVESVNEESRTVELVWSTGAPVERYDWMSGKRYIEKLSLEPGAVRLERLNDGGPLLDSHSYWSVADQLGAVVAGTVRIAKGEGRATVQFSRRESVEGIWQDVRDGLIRSVSVGYRVHRFEESTAKGNELPVRTATDWEPFEISMVPIPADAGAKVREGKSDDANSCEIVPAGYVARALETREMPHDMNMPKVGDQIKVVRPHEPAHDGAAGTVRQVIGQALGVEFDDMPGEIHQWYLPTEVVVTKAMEMAPEDRSATQLKTTTKETKSMENDRAAESIVADLTLTAPKKAAPAEPTDADRARSAEKARVEAIRQACRFGRVSRALEDELIDADATIEKAQARVLEEVAKRGGDDTAAQRPHVEIVGDDPFVHVRDGIVEAILFKAHPRQSIIERGQTREVGFALTDRAKPYMGLSLIRIAERFLVARGRRTEGLSEMDMAGLALRGDGMHSTSDFPYLLADVANKTLRAGYDEAQPTFGPIVRRTTVPDFKQVKRNQFGEAPQLEKVGEHGEIKSGTIGEGREAYAIDTYAVKFAITRKALINDDLNAFARVPLNMGRQARQTESNLVWAQITSNPAMGDGENLFSSAHANIDSAGAAISIESIGGGRTAMRLQTALDGTTLLNVVPRYLVVPATLETVADQFVSQALAPSQASAVNPFAGRLTVLSEARLDAADTEAWYLAAAIGEFPDIIELALLEGQSGPRLDQEEGFDIEGLKFKVAHDVGAKVIDWRGLYKNVGAS